jgi:uncharacterized protein
MTRLEKRQCGPCTVCCTELKIPQLRKEARVPCRHLTASGCGIYAERPDVCREFLCGWRLFEDMGDDWRPDLSGVMALRWAPNQLPAAWKVAPYGVHLLVIGGEQAVMRPAFITYVARTMGRGLPIFLSAASPYILLNDHVPAGADVTVLKQRLAELYPLLHAARFGQSLWQRIRFLYRLQIDRGYQKHLGKSAT